MRLTSPGRNGATAARLAGALAALLVGLSGGWLAPTPALALSEIQREDPTPPPSDISKPEQLPPVPGAQNPSSVTEPPPADGDQTAPDTNPPAGGGEANPDQPTGAPGTPGAEDNLAAPANDPNAPIPPIEYDLSKLPEPVRRMHDLIVEACKTGDIEKLRPLLGTGESQTQLTFGDLEGDPIEFLHNLSGDEQGDEILAIIEEVLSAGYVHLDAGTEDELYIWPYFFAIPLEKLTPPQRVELFKIITGGDYEEMRAYGGYTFYRIGITPKGEWQFFVAGS